MNYYYDIILNWGEEAAYEFYEWNDTDCIELVKKMPIFKVKHKTLVDLMTNQVKVDNVFLDLIKDRTLLCGKSIIKKMPYAALFSDNKNTIAIEFNSEGLSICYSKLMIDDELQVLELNYGLKDYELKYELVKKLELRSSIRQEEEAKHLIKVELNSLIENQKIDKLKYLYYEYKGVEENDVNVIFLNIQKDLKKGFNQDILKLYYIIKLSYHNV